MLDDCQNISQYEISMPLKFITWNLKLTACYKNQNNTIQNYQNWSSRGGKLKKKK